MLTGSLEDLCGLIPTDDALGELAESLPWTSLDMDDFQSGTSTQNQLHQLQHSKPTLLESHQPELCSMSAKRLHRTSDKIMHTQIKGLANAESYYDDILSDGREEATPGPSAANRCHRDQLFVPGKALSDFSEAQGQIISAPDSIVIHGHGDWDPSAARAANVAQEMVLRAEMEKLDSFQAGITRFDHGLPLARIKRIAKQDTYFHPRRMGASCTPALSMAVMLFIRTVSARAWQFTYASQRRTMQVKDLVAALEASDKFDFLCDVIAENMGTPLPSESCMRQAKVPPLERQRGSPPLEPSEGLETSSKPDVPDVPMRDQNLQRMQEAREAAASAAAVAAAVADRADILVPMK